MEIIDFLSAFLSDPLTVIQDLIHQYDYLIYFILFLVIFAETGFVLCLFYLEIPYFLLLE